MKSASIGFIFSCVGSSLFANQTAHMVIEPGAISNAAFNTAFVAKTALFIAFLYFGVTFIGALLKKSIGLPTIAGQIIGGIVLGPSVLNSIAWRYFSSPVSICATNGMAYSVACGDLILFFISMISSLVTVSCLLWMAGHETDVDQLRKVGFVALVAGILGALVPIAMTVALLAITTASLSAKIAMGIIFSATSVSIPVAMLIFYKKMQTRSARATMAAAVVDDIAAVLLLSFFFIAFPAPGAHQHGSLLTSLGYMALGAGLLYCIGSFIIPIISRAAHKHDESLLATISYGIMMGYFALTELVAGLAGITGSYFAGLFARKNDKQHYSYGIIAPFVQTLLLPLFLGSIGLSVDLKVLSLASWGLVALLLLGAIVSKLIACFIATWIANRSIKDVSQRWSSLESYLFGSSMVARGEVGLVVASIVKSAGLISFEWYTIAIVVIVLTTIATPIMLSYGFSREKKRGQYEYVLSLGSSLDDSDIQHIIARIEQAGLSVRMTGPHHIAIGDDPVVVALRHDRAHITGQPGTVHSVLPLLDKTVQELPPKR